MVFYNSTDLLLVVVRKGGVGHVPSNSIMFNDSRRSRVPSG